MRTVIILGSGPSVIQARDWAKAPFQAVVAINNAWQVRPDWDFLIHPEDFPIDRRPHSYKIGQEIICAQDYVPIQNKFGGFVYAGGTMAFTAAYWALGALKPSVIAMIGCDMVYPQKGPTHFYGTGSADPLRQDVTLRSLEAKSARLWALAAYFGCAIVNLSDEPKSRLVYPRQKHSSLSSVETTFFDRTKIENALRAEAETGYIVPSGRYWEVAYKFDTQLIDRIDQLWLEIASEQKSKTETA